MTIQKHTPTPWRKGARIPDEHGIRIESTEGLAAVARAAGGPWADAEANARFIVRACNSHYDLLALILTMKKCILDEPGESNPSVLSWLAKCDAAIAKATGAAS